MDLKYNFVILGSNNDFYRISYRNISNTDKTRYISTNIDTDNVILNLLYKIHCSETIENIVKLPFKSIWNRHYYKNTFNNDNPICFVFTGSHILKFDYGFDKYLRKTYPNCKLVIFYQDLIKGKWKKYFEKFKDRFDLILSFDQKDAEDYGLIYYPLVYTPEEYEVEDVLPRSDVYFVGKAKNRLDKILDIYVKLRDAGLKCDFNITGVKPEDQMFSDEINYCAQMPYVENIKHIKATKCMLEIMQGGGHGYTLRYGEAICYGKKLITNNPEIKDAPFYNPDLIQVITDDGILDTNFVLKGDFVVDYNFKEELSPKKLLEFIDNNL